MAEEESKLSRATRLVIKCQWQTQELKLKRTKMPDVEKLDENGNVVIENGKPVMVEHSVSRKRLVRKCEFPNAEAAKDVVDFLSSDECLGYLKFCRKELNRAIGEGVDSTTEWAPVQAWYSEEDATSGRARHGMLYHVLKAKGDDGDADGPYVTTDGCKYHEEYYFYWDVDEPPELPKSSSGVQWSMDVKRRDDSDGLGGLYDCTMVKRTTIQQDVEPYESHHELGETRITAQMLGVTGEDQEAIDTKVEAFAAEQGMQLEDGPVYEKKEDGSDDLTKPTGVVVDISKEKNADCTTSVSIVNTKEEKNPRSTVIGEQTIRAKKLTVVDENVAPETGESGDAYPLTEVKDGKVVRKTVTKTKGGVRVIQTETTEAVEVEDGKGTVSCEKTIFEHQHTSVAEGQDSATADATEAGGGKTYRVQSTLRDDGKFDIQSTETEELSVDDYVEHVTENGMSHTVDVTKKNQGVSDFTDPNPQVPTEAGTEDYQVGNQITDTQVTRTPGGAYDVRTVTRTPKKVVKNLVFAQNVTARRTTQLHVKIFENCQLTDIGFTAGTGDDAETYTQATYTDGSIRLNEYGLYDGQLQYYKDASDDEPDTEPKEAWAYGERTKTGITQFADNVWQYTETWVEAMGYIEEEDPQKIYSKFPKAQDIQVSPANRERTQWSVRIESPHYFVYTSIINSATHTVGTPNVATEYDEAGHATS